MSIKEFIQLRNENSQIEYRIHGVPIVFLHQVKFDVRSSVRSLEQRFPEKFFSGLKLIHVGEYPDLIHSDRTSAYNDNEIYLLSSLEEAEWQSALTHELAHHVETLFGKRIYGSQTVQREFIRKRLALFGKLSETISGLPRELFLDVNYSEQIEKLFFIDIGEEKMVSFVAGLFPNVYSAVSVREYFANGLENATADIKSSNYIRNLSPALYSAIENLFSEN